jgi:membrane-associated PAP2 superfamily phosphatase
MKLFFSRHWPWLLPVLILAAIAPWTPTLDLTLAHYFYQGSGQFSPSPLYSFIYDYGVVPAQLAVLAASITLLLSYCFKKYKKWRQASLLMILPLLIGAGFIVHTVFKENWGRPRPKQVEQFGGNQKFLPFYNPNFSEKPEPAKSFACGHCTMGFYFFALALLGRKLKKPILFWTGLIAAFGLGIILSWTRLAQGGHFLSDTLISALIMWLTAYGCSLFLFPDEQKTG